MSKQPYEVLEQRLADWSGCGPSHPNVVACNSGTAALHLALEALQLPPGAEVAVPDFAFVAVARAVVLSDLVPVFIDCGPDLNMDLDLLDEACSQRRIEAVLAVHTYGRRVKTEQLHELACKYGFAVVEDLAEAHGVAPHHSSFAACWSFYRNKIVRAEEGGAVAFCDDRRAEFARSMRCQGQTDRQWHHAPRGMNYRMTNVMAAMVMESLASFEPEIALRRQREAMLDASCPAKWRMPRRDSPWMYDLLLDRDYAETCREGARSGFRPLSLQPEFSEEARYGGRVAERMSKRLVALPLDRAVDPAVPQCFKEEYGSSI